MKTHFRCGEGQRSLYIHCGVGEQGLRRVPTMKTQNHTIVVPKKENNVLKYIENDVKILQRFEQEMQQSLRKTG